MEFETLHFDRMAPDSGEYDYDNGLSELSSGSVKLSDHDSLVPRILRMDAGLAGVVSGNNLLSCSGQLERVFFTTDTPKLYEWVPDYLNSTVTDRTDGVGDLALDGYRSFVRWGNWYIASPQSGSGTGAELLKYEPGVDVQFVRFVASVNKPTGRFIDKVASHAMLFDIYDPVTGIRQKNGYAWSASRDITNWNYGTNRSGYGEIIFDPENNDIIGALGWPKFSTIWTKTGICRLTLRGGLTLFDLDQIASGSQVMFGSNAVKYGKHAFYIAHDGPRVCLNGEETRSIGLGVVSRFFMDKSYSDYAIKKVYRGFLDPVHDLVYWIVECEGFPGQWFAFVYSVSSESWSVIPLGSNTDLQLPSSFNVFSDASGYDSEQGITPSGFSYVNHGNPLWNLIFLENPKTPNWRIHTQSFQRAGLQLERKTYPVVKISKVWRPRDFAGGNFIIKKLRPIIDFRKNSGSDKFVSFDINYGMTSDASTFNTINVTADANSVDPQGFMKDQLPINASWVQIVATFPDTDYSAGSYESPSAYPCLKQFSGVEFGFDLRSDRAA